MESCSMELEDNSSQRKWYEGGSICLLETREEVIAGWREMRNPEYWKRMRQEKELKDNEKDKVVMVTTYSENPTNMKTQALVSYVEQDIKIFWSHLRELMAPVGMLGNQVGMLACQLGTLEEKLQTLEGKHVDIINGLEGVTMELRDMTQQLEAMVAQNTILTRRIAALEAAYSRRVNGGVTSQIKEIAPAEGSSEKAPEDSIITDDIGRGCRDADVEAASTWNDEIIGGKSATAISMGTIKSEDLELEEVSVARSNIEGVNSHDRFISGALNLEEDQVLNNELDETLRCQSSSSHDSTNASSKSSELQPDVSGVLMSEISGNGASNSGVIHHTDAHQKRTNVEDVSEKSIFSNEVEGVIPVDQSVSVTLNLEMRNDLNTEHDASSGPESSLGKVSVKLAHDDSGMSAPENGVDVTGKGKCSGKGRILPCTNGKQGGRGTRKRITSTQTNRRRRNRQVRIPPSEVKPFEFECDACKKRLSSKSSLNRHLKYHKTPKKHECSYCSSKFQSRKDLTRHLIIHTGLTPWTCPICGKASNRKDNLARHLKLRHRKSREGSNEITDNVTKKYLEEHTSELKEGQLKQGRQSAVYQLAVDLFQN